MLHCFPPDNHGGLGVQNLKLAGNALRTRWLWLQRTEPERAWAALPFKVEPHVQDLFDASIKVQVGSGTRTFFWRDSWLDDRFIEDIAPSLAILISSRVKKSRTVAQALYNRQWVRDITGGLSIAALIEYLHLLDRLEQVQLDPHQDDIISWKRTPHGRYSAQSTYLLMHQGVTLFPGADLLWGCWALLRVKLFLWLACRR